MNNEVRCNNDLELKAIENRIIRLKNETAQNLIKLGNELNRAKEKVPHGEWGTWLRDKVNFSQRTANIYHVVVMVLNNLHLSQYLHSLLHSR